MKVLEKRQIALINLLALENDWLPATRASELLNVSVSTLRRDIEVINTFYHGKENRIDSKPGLGLKIFIDKGLSLPHDSSDHSTHEILRSKRLIGITTDLLTHSPNPLSINALAEKYFISRSSIVVDLKKIEVWIALFSLEMIKNHTGTYIEGSDFNIRVALKDIITHSVLNNYQMTDSRIDRFSRVQLIKDFGKANVANCMALISMIEEELHCSISEPYYTNLFSHLLVTIKRSENRKNNEEMIDDFIRADNKEWLIAEKAIEWLRNEYKAIFPSVEINYVYQYIISSRINLLSNSSPSVQHHYNDATNYATTLVEETSKLLSVDLSYDRELISSLSSHIKPMLNRLTYNITIHNPLLNDIKNELFPVFSSVKSAVSDINSKLNLPLPSDDEVAYLTVYIQASIEKTKVSKKIILVCSSGVGTSQLLYGRIKRIFPECEIVDIVSGSKLKETLEHKDCDLIISTIRLDDINTPVVYVSAFFSMKDIARVTEYLGESLSSKN